MIESFSQFSEVVNRMRGMSRAGNRSRTEVAMKMGLMQVWEG